MSHVTVVTLNDIRLSGMPIFMKFKDHQHEVIFSNLVDDPLCMVIMLFCMPFCENYEKIVMKL